MPAVIPFIPLIVGGLAATASVVSSKLSSNTAARTAKDALGYAKEQEAERRREWEIQSKAAQHQWDVQQANLAPYRAARAAILKKHGIDVPDYVAPPMPEGYGGVPSTFGGALPGSAAPKSGGGAGGAIALGALGSLAAGFGSYYANKPSYNSIGSGPTTAGLSTGGVGYQMSPLTSNYGSNLPTPDQYSMLAGLGGPNPGIVPTSSLPNWSAYSAAQPYTPYGSGIGGGE